MLSKNTLVVHGGTDALGVPAHDLSTNRNAGGPCPAAVQALQAAHSAQYPDPHYTDVGVRSWRLFTAWHRNAS